MGWTKRFGKVCVQRSRIEEEIDNGSKMGGIPGKDMGSSR